MEMIKLGPLGNYKRESHWEETGRDTISHIFVTFDYSSRVTSIKFGYVENGALVYSKKYGREDTKEDSTRIVWLNHETEFVTRISGEGWYSNPTSLTFHTNERTHEVFRFEVESSLRGGGRYANIELHSGIHDRLQFGGFFGSSNYYEFSIGLYLKPILSAGENTIKQENV